MYFLFCATYETIVLPSSGKKLFVSISRGWQHQKGIFRNTLLWNLCIGRTVYFALELVH
jgi:hypothetical protein